MYLSIRNKEAHSYINNTNHFIRVTITYTRITLCIVGLRLITNDWLTVYRKFCQLCNCHDSTVIGRVAEGECVFLAKDIRNLAAKSNQECCQVLSHLCRVSGHGGQNC